MKEIVYLELEEVEAIHDQMLELFGGAPGFKGGEEGRGLLASALNRPRNKAFYEGWELLAQAGSLMFAIAKNHGFIDGNKRTAAVVTDVFLQDNGYELSCDNDTLADFVEKLSDKGFEAEYNELAAVEFVRRHAVVFVSRE